MFDWLKEILGESYTEEIGRRAASEVGKAFVSKEDFNGVNRAKKKLEEELATRKQKLDLLSEVNPEQLQAEIDRLKEEERIAQESWEKERTRMQKSMAVQMALVGEVHDPADVLDQIDLERLELDETGRLRGDMKQLLAPLREKKPYLFLEKAADVPAVLCGAVPAPPGVRKTAEETEMQEWRRSAGLSI